MRVRPVLPALVLLLAPLAGAFEISNGTTNETKPFLHFDAPSSALADFDGDGRAEIVAHNENRALYVLDSGTGRVRAELQPPYPEWGARVLSEPVVADVDADGWLDVVLVTSAATVCVFEHTGTSGEALSFAQRWCRRMNAHWDGPGADGGPWVEDVTGDGRAEIFAQTEERGLYAFNYDGSVRWSKADYGGNAGPTVADLNGDGRKEAIFFSDGGMVRAFDASSGVWRWSFDARAYVRPGAIPVSGAVGDLDNDGRKEVVFTARHATDTANYANNHVMLFVLRSDGTLKWRAQPSFAHPLSYTHPLLVDVNGDGRRDVVLQDWNTIGHKPGNWEQLGPAHVFAYSSTGAFLWRTDLANGWSNDDLLLLDADGDARLDLLAVGMDGGREGVWALNPANGAKKFHIPVPSGWVVNRAPIAGDLAGDGKLGLVIPATRGTEGALFVVSRSTPCLVAYGGWSVRSPCDPLQSDGSQPPPPPPPPEDYAPAFRPVPGNSWWVEVRVESDRPLAGVDARANGGAWVALELRSWGAWAKSFHVPTGSTVEFRARAADGATAISGGYRWPDATPTSGTGGGESFTASFLNVRGNAWWVETDVRANEALAGVDARVNGGAWTPLEKKSWGSWARSIYVPSGATVEFRARSADGDSVVSAGYRWPPA